VVDISGTLRISATDSEGEGELDEYLEGYRGKKVVVTGGAGCIGSNVIRVLLGADVGTVFVVDDLSSAERWNVPDDTRVVFIQGSILDEEILRRAFSEGPDYVFHLAAHFANQNSVDHPETDLMVNGLGTLRVLEYSHIAKVKRFVFASAGCAMYGSDPPLPVHEDLPISTRMETPYQITKFLGELYCNYFHSHHGLPTVRPRIHNSYGPGEVPGSYRNVIPNFIWRAMHSLPLPITGTGEESRDFVFVMDIVQGLLRCGTVADAVGEEFNLASSRETKVIDIANEVNRLLDSRAGLVFQERRSWDRMLRRKGSFEKARRVLGYEPGTEFNDGLRQTVDWFLENRQRIDQAVRF
jgi:nucleoside-diphosphate-sugar epimerase